jgi:hypothetical protein
MIEFRHKVMMCLNNRTILSDSFAISKRTFGVSSYIFNVRELYNEGDTSASAGELQQKGSEGAWGMSCPWFCSLPSLAFLDGLFVFSIKLEPRCLPYVLVWV